MKIKHTLICTYLLFSILAAPACLYSQVQHIKITGRISDSENLPIKDAELSVIFNGNILANANADSAGTYSIQHTFYGNIDSIILWVGQNHRTLLFNKKLPIECIYDLQIEGKQGVYEISMPDVPRGCGDFFPFFIVESRMFRLPTGTFAYYKPGYFDPIYYHKKMSYRFLVKDENGMPIKNAKVEIIVPDDEIRWGITNEKGELTIHANYPKGILDGKIYISAEGYHNRKLLFQKFGMDNFTTFKLRKIKQTT